MTAGMTPGMTPGMSAGLTLAPLRPQSPAGRPGSAAGASMTDDFAAVLESARGKPEGGSGERVARSASRREPVAEALEPPCVTALAPISQQGIAGVVAAPPLDAGVLPAPPSDGRDAVLTPALARKTGGTIDTASGSPRPKHVSQDGSPKSFGGARDGDETSSPAAANRDGLEVSGDVASPARPDIDSAASITGVAVTTHLAAASPSPAMQVADALMPLIAPPTVPVAAPDGPAASAPAAPVAPSSPDIPTREKVQTIVLDLQPEHHGAVQVRLRLVGDELRIGIVARKHETASALDTDRAALTERLAHAGYRVASLDVVWSPSPSSNSAGDARSPDREPTSQGQSPADDGPMQRRHRPADQNEANEKTRRPYRRPDDLRL